MRVILITNHQENESNNWDISPDEHLEIMN
jgi:hypothetical protein